MTETIFMTGGTGFIGSYVLHHLLTHTSHRVALLVRARDRREAEEKLWKGLQLHVGPEEFFELASRVEFVHGDLVAKDLGIDPAVRDALVKRIGSVLHVAASLNRKSAKHCMNANLRGTLAVVKLARAAADFGGLRVFSDVSTTAVAGHRSRETLSEDEMIDWDRSDYDPYARTKKFGEHMVRELLPDVRHLFFRPSSVLGDGRRPETTQFDMTRMCMLVELPILPLAPDARFDIVNADWVGRAIATLHAKERPAHDVYNLSSGEGSKTAQEIVRTLAEHDGRTPPVFVPDLEKPFETLIRAAGLVPGKNPFTQMAALLEVFWPYMTFDTVFRNDRAVVEVGAAPVPFTEYCGELYRWVRDVKWKYPYRPFPERPATAQVGGEGGVRAEGAGEPRGATKVRA